MDELPVIKKFEKLNYKKLLKDYEKTHLKCLKPIKSRGNNPVPSNTTCPRCRAPHVYLYDNTGGRSQLWCKVCDLRFNKTKRDFSPVSFICPYCCHTLTKKKDRKHFNIHKCVNKRCPFYIVALKKLSPEEFMEYQDDKHKFKLHYIYRNSQ